MELVNEFTVNRPIDEAWAVLTDVERIAPCLPGAQLQEIEGEIYRGVVKVKVGPISAALKGEASFVERDDANHRAVLKGDGRDTKGNGNASALITASLKELTPTSAKCVVHTDLNMTGKVAQFGRGALADISSKLMQQFAKNLDEMLAKDGATAPTPTETTSATPTEKVTAASAKTSPEKTSPAKTSPAKASPAKTSPAKANSNTGKGNKGEDITGEDGAGENEQSVGVTAETVTPPTVRTINGPAAEPIDALGLGGHAILKRMLPVFGGLVILLLVLRRLRK